jgi:hypothetical protein
MQTYAHHAASAPMPQPAACRAATTGGGGLTSSGMHAAAGTAAPAPLSGSDTKSDSNEEGWIWSIAPDTPTSRVLRTLGRLGVPEGKALELNASRWSEDDYAPFAEEMARGFGVQLTAVQIERLSALRTTQPHLVKAHSLAALLTNMRRLLAPLCQQSLLILIRRVAQRCGALAAAQCRPCTLAGGGPRAPPASLPTHRATSSRGPISLHRLPCLPCRPRPRVRLRPCNVPGPPSTAPSAGPSLLPRLPPPVLPPPLPPLWPRSALMLVTKLVDSIDQVWAEVSASGGESGCICVALDGCPPGTLQHVRPDGSVGKFPVYTLDCSEPR